MKLKSKQVSDLRYGDILAHNIFNDRDTLIMAHKTKLNKNLIERLGNFKVDEVAVFTNNSFDDGQTDREFLKFRKKYKECEEILKSVFKDILDGRRTLMDRLGNICDILLDKMEFDVQHLQYIRKLYDSKTCLCQHSLNVALISMIIGRGVELHRSSFKKLLIASLLHDIGKALIPEEILCKPSRLTEQELAIARQHPVKGYELLKKIGGFDLDILTAVLLHHEKNDGTGYPFNMAGEKLGQITRIISISNKYDSLTSNRVYKEELSPFDAFEVLREEGLQYYDVNAVKLFLKNLSKTMIGKRVILNNGNVGIVVDFPIECSRPNIIVNGRLEELENKPEYRITHIID